jgi:hypothetical protein
VDGFFSRQPESPKPILDVVAPIDTAFYRPILGFQEKS